MPTIDHYGSRLVARMRREDQKVDKWSHLAPDERADLEASLLAAQLKNAPDDKKPAIREQITAWKAYSRRARMSKIHDSYRKALNGFADGFIAIAEQIKQFDERKDMFPLGWYTNERLRLVREARAADAGTLDAVTKYRDAAMAEAQKLRAKAEAEADPTTRLADELERQRLAQSTLDGAEFARQAAEMLANGQPARAKLLLAVAVGKGARMADSLAADIEEALDQADETRARAREIEDTVAQNVNQYGGIRLRHLAASGLGQSEDGQAGRGLSGEAARASINAKIAEHFARRGAPAEDGAE